MSVDWTQVVTSQDRANAENDARSDAITVERDRRLRAGFEFLGTMYDFDEVSKSRITGAATLAGFAMGAGAKAGNFFWANPKEGFAWIAADNSVVAMDAPTAFAFGQAAAGHESAHIFAAFALKAMGNPTDFADDKWWP